jgi:hypothetical protein
MRTESLSRSFFAVAAVVLAVVVAVAGLAAAKQGKSGKAKKLDVVSTTQSEILNTGAIKVRGGGKNVAVRGLDGSGKSLGALTKAKAGKTGKTKKASASKGAKAKSLALTSRGRELLSGCTVATLQAYKAKQGKSGKTKRLASAAAASESLNRDLGICSTGSENPTARPYIGAPIPTDNADRCDFLDPTVCMQPWPNDYFTIADGSTDSGRRLNFNINSMPKNTAGTPIDVSDLNRADGYSPGNMIVVKIPQVQTQAAFNNSGLTPITNIHKFDDEGQAAIVIDAASGERQPIFAELDANSPPDETNLLIRPLRNFEEGHRYIVALRNLRDASNNPVDPPLPFRVYRDRLITTQAAVENRRPHMEDVIGDLQDAGFARSNLYMAWDFTVASERSLSERALALRDDALLRLGDTTAGDGMISGSGDSTPGDGVVDGDAPDFNISTVTDFTPCGMDGCQAGENDNLLRQVDGELTNVPCYMDNFCRAGTQFSYSNSTTNVPVIDPTTFADDNDGSTGVRFRCIIPRSVDAGSTVAPAKPGTYGHGLLGEYTQVNGQQTLANQNNSIWCATNWSGFSADDLGPGVLLAMIDLSKFGRLVDRMQQGFVNFHYLGRALINPDGFSDDPAFQIDPDDGGPEGMTPVIDTDELYFEGISQGAIMGGALTANSPDFTRAVLNVPGMNYSTLLRRSVDTAEYVELPNFGLYFNYPSLRERPLILSLMQLLWDRGETNGYAHHATDDPLPNTPAHKILLQPAYGDHQVANLAAEVEARTIGARLHAPALKAGRHWEANPFMQLPAIDFGTGPGYTPYDGSAIVYYDGGPLGFDGTSDCTDEHGMPQHGTAPTPNTNVPPRPLSVYGCDPHGYPRRAADGLTHVAQFLQPNGFILPCTTAGVIRPCYANGYDGS